MYMSGSRGEGQRVRGRASPMENHKAKWLFSNTGPETLEIHKTIYRASIQCWTIIGPPAKRHLNGEILK